MAMPTQHQGLPVACKLEAGELAARHSEITEQIFSQVRESVELDDGYAYQFPGDDELLEKLTGFVRYERHCCPFLTFELLFEPDHGPITLSLRGPDGTKAFLEGMRSDSNAV